MIPGEAGSGAGAADRMAGSLNGPAPAALGRLGPLLIFFGSSVVFGICAAGATWKYLPYEALERITPEEQFLVWEGVVWLLALLLIFLGLSNILDEMGWRLRLALRELMQRLDPQDPRATLLSSGTLPWWMLTAGAVLIAIASLARGLLAP